MEREKFLSMVKSDSPAKLARTFLLADQVAAFPDVPSYAQFKQRVAAAFGTEQVHLAGSGNWGYSLHPEKSFKPFDNSSDLDVAVISNEQFNQLWSEMRRGHRQKWHLLPDQERKNLRRNAENVYAGFISPLWLPDYQSAKRLEFRRHFNRLSDRNVGFRPVKAFFFKNLDEAVSYYERGFVKARRALK
jgi:hypothetical protein